MDKIVIEQKKEKGILIESFKDGNIILSQKDILIGAVVLEKVNILDFCIALSKLSDQKIIIATEGDPITFIEWLNALERLFKTNGYHGKDGIHARTPFEWEEEYKSGKSAYQTFSATIK